MQMKRALIYNNYLHTVGGGERACLDACLALESLGYNIALATASSFSGSIENICSIFGLKPQHTWDLVKIKDEDELAAFCRENPCDVFVNSTFCSSMPNPAQIGFYMLMFPPIIGDAEKSRLRTYQKILINSEFSSIYLASLWGKDFPCAVVPPPISKAHFEGETDFKSKTPTILLVGRFNVDGHCKCQLEAIRAFNKLKKSQVLTPEWRLQLAGNLNPGNENEVYLERCRREAGVDVDIEINVPFARLQELYARSTCLWQFTGVDYRLGENAQFCEHLGLVALDALCYGTVPIVYQRSGVSFMIDYGKNGFMFRDEAELTQVMSFIGRAYQTAEHERFFWAARQSAARYGFESFVGTLKSILADIVGDSARNCEKQSSIISEVPSHGATGN